MIESLQPDDLFPSHVLFYHDPESPEGCWLCARCELVTISRGYAYEGEPWGMGGWDIKDLTKTWGSWRKYDFFLKWFGLSGKMELRIGKAWEE